MKTLVLFAWSLLVGLVLLAACGPEPKLALDDPEAQMVQALGETGASGDLARTLMFMRSPTETVALDANRLQALALMQQAALSHKQQTQAATFAAEVEMQAARLATWQQVGFWLAVAGVVAVLIRAFRDVAVASMLRPAPQAPALLVNFAAMLEQQGHSVEVEEVDGEWWAFDDTTMTRYNGEDARRGLIAPRLTDTRM